MGLLWLTVGLIAACLVLAFLALVALGSFLMSLVDDTPATNWQGVPSVPSVGGPPPTTPWP